MMRVFKGENMDDNRKIKDAKLTDLPNIGVALEKQLLAIGILTYEDLKRIGAKEAWLKIQEIDESACINRLLALEGAILGVKKSLLPVENKEEMREFYGRYKK